MMPSVDFYKKLLALWFLYRVAQRERNSRYSRFSGLCSTEQLLSSLCWIEHLFPIIITPIGLYVYCINKLVSSSLLFQIQYICSMQQLDGNKS